jgi:hypothetical protein
MDLDGVLEVLKEVEFDDDENCPSCYAEQQHLKGC